ncbi:hypothetical protein Pcinc_010980 [Petrolisthes cinctipes]|uniref:Uncharacterized protein n=1 Tax=Petrolisthes cinctipes TaxID=88211 RepID=A0AAE1G3W2_PETCI|nr:hypothetical protein Pcinc_010980 [Petrolisthes cinctipes]
MGSEGSDVPSLVLGPNGRVSDQGGGMKGWWETEKEGGGWRRRGERIKRGREWEEEEKGCRVVRDILCQLAHAHDVSLVMSFVWMPSHIGLAGNDMADGLPKAAFMLDVGDMAAEPSLRCQRNTIYSAGFAMTRIIMELNWSRCAICQQDTSEPLKCPLQSRDPSDKTGEEESVLHEVSTFDTDKNIRDMITELNDTQLLTRICGGDLMAMEAKYHLSCMVKLRNRHRSLIRKQSQVPDDIDSKMNESRAFVELTRYIEEVVTSGTHLFKLSEIHSFHVTRLEELNINKQVNKTRLKDRLLEQIP